MRKDMTNRFTEHHKISKPKFPRHSKKFNWKDEDGQETCSPKGMKHAHYISHNWIWRDAGCVDGNYNLLKRFLHSCTGRPWNEVYSEVCEESDERSFRGYNFREWIDHLVEKNCFLDKDGTVLDERGNTIANFWGGFFVHPKTKTLEFADVKKRPRWEPPHTVFEVDGKLFHQHKDIWYRVEMREVSEENRSDGWWKWVGPGDAFLSGTVTFGIFSYQVVPKIQKKYGLSPNKKSWYCFKKESANSREISKIKKKLS